MSLQQAFWTRDSHDDGNDQRTTALPATMPESNENQTAKLVERRLAALRKSGQKKNKNISSYMNVIDSEKDAVLTELNARLAEKRRIACFQAHYRRHCKKLQKQDQASTISAPSYFDKRQVDQWLADEEKTDKNSRQDENHVLMDMEIDDGNDTAESEAPGNAQDLMDSAEETLESIKKHLGEPVSNISSLLAWLQCFVEF